MSVLRGALFAETVDVVSSRKRVLDDALRGRIVDFVRANHTYPEAATFFNLGVYIVRRACQEAGVRSPYQRRHGSRRHMPLHACPVHGSEHCFTKNGKRKETWHYCSRGTRGIKWREEDKANNAKHDGKGVRRVPAGVTGTLEETYALSSSEPFRSSEKK